MSVHLFDPRHAKETDWPMQNLLERAYLTEVAKAGVSQMINNVHTEWQALRSGEKVFPVTINYGEYGGSYVCLPHSAYVLYGRQELDIIDMGRWTPLLKMLISWIDKCLRWADINRIIHVDNWLLSTNLHGNWSGADLPDIRKFITDKFPNHILAVRSVDTWSSPELLNAAQSDGWTLLPSRQIWVTNDMKRWKQKNSTRNDARLLRNSSLEIGPITSLRRGDAARIADLYHQLYVGKYSPLNPIFTKDYVRTTFESGLFHYHGARAQDGKLMAVCGSFERGGILTPPIVGYDTNRSKKDGLYRIACYLFNQHCLDKGFRLNGSAGASDFKKCRGALPVTEYSAIYVNHLSRKRRIALKTFAWALRRFLVPEMRKREL
ncbi:MAG: hypothetical protein ABJG88_02155 [Litorimonas sp.]